LSGTVSRLNGTNDGKNAARSATMPQAATELQSETMRGKIPSSTGTLRIAQIDATAIQTTQHPRERVTRSE